MISISGCISLNSGLRLSLSTAMLSHGRTLSSNSVETCWEDESITLGCCADGAAVSTGGQPAISIDQRWVVVLDGRIDDCPDELWEKCGKDRAHVTAATLAAAAFARWGRHGLQCLIGDFALAAWDRHSRRLYCATDRMGARPLLYWSQPGVFVFASTEDALLAVPSAPRVPDDEMVATMLAPGFRSSTTGRSWIAGISALGAGQVLEVGPEGVIGCTRYWAFEPGENAPFRSEDESIEAFQSVFAQAVRDRVPREGSFSMMLSGGLDSAAILTTMARYVDGYRDRLAGYSVVDSEQAGCLESACIRDLAARHLSDWNTVPVSMLSGGAWIGDLQEVAWARAHPVDNGTLLPALMCRLAARRGHGVMLTGAVGDVTLDVPDRYIAYRFLNGGSLDAWREAVAANHRNTYLRGSGAMQLLLANAWTAYAPHYLKRVVHGLRQSTHPRVPAIVSRDFSKRIRLAERLQEQVRRDGHNRTLSLNVQVDAARLLNGPDGPVRGLQGFAKIGARYGLETRDPWGDVRVAEFFLRLPLRLKVRDGWTKYLVRRSLAGAVGEDVQWRVGKEHLGWRLIEHAVDTVHDEIIHSLNTGEEELAPFIDVHALRSLAVRYSAQRATYAGRWSADRSAVFDIMSLLAWFRRLRGAGAFAS